MCTAERENDESEVDVKTRETKAAVGLYSARIESERKVRDDSRGQGGGQKSEGRRGIGNGAMGGRAFTGIEVVRALKGSTGSRFQESVVLGMETEVERRAWSARFLNWGYSGPRAVSVSPAYSGKLCRHIMDAILCLTCSDCTILYNAR